MIGAMSSASSDHVSGSSAAPQPGRGETPPLERIAILGDGQFGLVMADALAARGCRPIVWGRRPDHIASLEQLRECRERLPGFQFSPAVSFTSDPAVAFDGVELVLNAIPTQFISAVWTSVAPAGIPDYMPVVCVSKGIEVETCRTPTEVIAESLESCGIQPGPACALSGPTIAVELARHLPAAMVAASPDHALATTVQDLFTVPWIRVYSHDDLIGTEIAGAVKNVIALAAGIIDGLGVGDNAKSALVSRGLSEAASLGRAMGARTETFFGVAGVGDLVTTCFSPSGRNRTCGQRIGSGETLDAILESSVCVVEGVPTTKGILKLADERGVDMPITRAVYSVLFDGVTPEEAIRGLMTRALKAETIG